MSRAGVVGTSGAQQFHQVIAAPGITMAAAGKNPPRLRCGQSDVAVRITGDRHHCHQLGTRFHLIADIDMEQDHAALRRADHLDIFEWCHRAVEIYFQLDVCDRQ